jgi:hypothetical protein
VEAIAIRNPRGPGRLLLAALLVLVALVVLPVLVYELTRSAGAEGLREPPAVVSQSGMEAKSGVRVVRVTMSGDGGLLDLRYKIVDADKAHAVHNPKNPPLLVDEFTGGVINQPLMGHLHSGAPKLGLTYFVLFLNRGELVHRGSLVSVVIGNARLRHVRVQ